MPRDTPVTMAVFLFPVLALDSWRWSFSSMTMRNPQFPQCVFREVTHHTFHS